MSYPLDLKRGYSGKQFHSSRCFLYQIATPPFVCDSVKQGLASGTEDGLSASTERFALLMVTSLIERNAKWPNCGHAVTNNHGPWQPGILNKKANREKSSPHFPKGRLLLSWGRKASDWFSQGHKKGDTHLAHGCSDNTEWIRVCCTARACSKVVVTQGMEQSQQPRLHLLDLCSRTKT